MTGQHAKSPISLESNSNRPPGEHALKGPFHPMKTLLAFLPFIIFAILNRLAGTAPALIAAAAVSALFVLRDVVVSHRSVKVLDIGALILFSGLSAYSLIGRHSWSIVDIRLCVDSGLLLIVLVSLLIRQPFTLQYARERAPASAWADPRFVRSNYIITFVWAAALLAMVSADLLMLYASGIPKSFGVAITIAAFAGAVSFTSWYPRRRK